MKIWLCILSLFCWANIACAQAPAEYPDVPFSDSAYVDLSMFGSMQLSGECNFGGPTRGPRGMTRYEFAVAIARTLQRSLAKSEKNPAAAPALARLIAQFTPELQQLGISQAQIELAQKELASYHRSTPTEYADVPASDPAYEELKVFLDAGVFMESADSHGTSSVDRLLTRPEFAVLIVRMLKSIPIRNPINAATVTPLHPQQSDRLKKSPIAIAALARLVTQFKPELQEFGFNQSQLESIQKELSSLRESTPAPVAPFPDVPKTHWAFDAVERLRQSGIVVGYPASAAGRTFAR